MKSLVLAAGIFTLSVSACMTAPKSSLNLEKSSHPQRQPAAAVEASVDTSEDFKPLHDIGARGRIITEVAFNEQTKIEEYPTLNPRLPVQLPGFLIEHFPEEKDISPEVLEKMKSQLDSKDSGSPWMFLADLEVRRSLREMIKDKKFAVVTKSVCDEKAVAMGKGHETLERWSQGLKTDFQGAIILSYCLSAHSFLHEYFHLLQFNWQPGSEAPIAFHLMAERISKILGTIDPKKIGAVLYPFGEAQAALYAIRKMRLLYPPKEIESLQRSGFPNPSYEAAQRFQLRYYGQNFTWMVARISLVAGDDVDQKFREMIKLYEEVFPLHGETFNDHPIGWNRIFCFSPEKKKWLNDQRTELTLPDMPWHSMPKIAQRRCTKEIVNQR